LIKYIEQGLGQKEISAIYNCPLITITRKLKVFDLHTRGYKNEGKRIVDLTGRKFGRLLVLKMSEERSSDGHTRWICECSCENKTIKTYNSHDLVSEKTKSCGCIDRELKTIHGMYNTRLYRIYRGMIDRCYNPNRHEYEYYGGRGITICDEWLNDFMKFHNWAIKNNYKDNLTIERIENNSNYEPNNCKWATMKEQTNNQRNNRMVEDKDGFITLPQFCEKYNFNQTSLAYRFEQGDRGDRLIRPLKTDKNTYNNYWS